MLKRLASQMNLISTSPSSEISDQCLVPSTFFPETGSLSQSGGNPVLINLCSKYLSSPPRTRSASFTACLGFQEGSLGKRASTTPSLSLWLRSARRLKKNFGEFCIRHSVYASVVEGMFFFNHVFRGRSLH